MNFILKYENIEGDWGRLARKFNIDPQWTDERLHVNKREKDYKQYYNEESKELVTNLFQEDLERYKYEFHKNLRFYKRNSKSLNVDNYWDELINRFNDLDLKKINRMSLKDFKYKWKSMIVEDFKEKLEKIELNLLEL